MPRARQKSMEEKELPFYVELSKEERLIIIVATQMQHAAKHTDLDWAHDAIQVYTDINPSCETLNTITRKMDPNCEVTETDTDDPRHTHKEY